MKSLGAKSDSDADKGRVVPVLIGVIGSFVVSLCLLGVFAVVMTVKDFPQSAITPLACLSIAAGAFVGGLMTARIRRCNGLVNGLVTGIFFYLVLLLVGLIMREPVSGSMILLKVLLSAGFGGVGGVAGVNMKRRRARG